MTVQGVLPYYYNFPITSPGRSQVIDRCYYNTMADTPECLNASAANIVSAHFTVCQKPWTCYKSYANELCQYLHEQWFVLRKEAEEFFGIPVVDNPCSRGRGNHYVSMQLDSANFRNVSNFIPDDSMSLMRPTASSGYITDNYDNTVGGHVSK